MTDEIKESDEEIIFDEAEPEADANPLEKRVAELENLLADAEDEKLRAVADFQNYRRRSLQEAAHNREIATAALTEKLLPLLDNFARTIAAAESGADSDSLIEGIRLMDRQLRAALEEVNVRPIDALGQHFDPHLHDAVLTENSDQPEGTVLEVIEPGYKMGRRVLRPAKTRVSKGPAE